MFSRSLKGLIKKERNFERRPEKKQVVEIVESEEIEPIEPSIEPSIEPRIEPIELVMDPQDEKVELEDADYFTWSIFNMNKEDDDDEKKESEEKKKMHLPLKLQKWKEWREMEEKKQKLRYKTYFLLAILVYFLYSLLNNSSLTKEFLCGMSKMVSLDLRGGRLEILFWNVRKWFS